jgi:hypothetical protein
VWNHPFVNEEALASGLFSYPVMTLAPRITTSPRAPGASRFPALSMIPIVVVPVFGPTDAALRDDGGSGFDAIWCAASVMP